MPRARGERLLVLTLDLIDVPGIREVTRQAFAQMGRIDVVVSNAGYGLFGAADEAKPPLRLPPDLGKRDRPLPRQWVL